MTKDVQLLDAHGRPIVKQWANDCAEGSWRGPFFGIGELGGSFELGPLEDGWQRNLAVFRNPRIAVVYACVAAYAQSIATMGVAHMKILEQGGHQPVKTSALSRILRAPNEYQTRSDFFLNLVYTLMLRGNAYALAFRNDRFEVESLHLLPAHQTAPWIDPDSRAWYYAVGNNPMVGDLEMLVPARDVLHIRLHTTEGHPLVGRSPLEHAGAAMSINTAISGNEAAFFNNMSRPSGVLSSDVSLTEEQIGKLRGAFEGLSQGLNAGKVPVLPYGLKWQPMTITSQDAQLIEAFKMSIEEIARVYRVPLALVGDYTKATYNNTETLIASWLATGLGFVMEHLEMAFSRFFRLAADEHMEFNPDVLLRSNFEARINGLTKAIGGGLYSPNEARAREGLGAVEFGDEPRVQQQNVPLSAVGQMPEPAPRPDPPVPAPQPSEEEKLAAALIARKAIDRYIHA